MRSSRKKYVGTVFTRNNKSSDLEPHFLTSATTSRCLEVTKTAVDLLNCSESTKESIAGWWTFGLEVRLELWRNYGSYINKTEVKVLPVVDFSAKSAVLFVFCGRCKTGDPRPPSRAGLPGGRSLHENASHFKPNTQLSMHNWATFFYFAFQGHIIALNHGLLKWQISMPN